jgi:hypothetical protein
VPDDSSVARGVIDNLRESEDVKLPAAPSMADVSRRTGTPEERLDEELDESYEFAVRVAGLSPPNHDLRRRTAEAVNLLSDSRKAPTRKAVSEHTGIYQSKITEAAENDYPDLTRRQGQIPNRNRVAGDYTEAYDLVHTSDHPVTTGAVRDITPSTDLDQARSVLTHSQAREKTGLDPLPEVLDDNQASEASEYVDAVARQMDRDSAFEVHETSCKKNRSSVSFSAYGDDYDLVFVEAAGRRITNMMSSEEGESYEGDSPSGSAAPQELVSDIQDKLG